jgi:hypothetical protein
MRRGRTAAAFIRSPGSRDRKLLNTDPGWPADHDTAAMDWVRERLAD